MVLPLLAEDPRSAAAVQRTTMSLDVLGRFLCNTLDEALAPAQALPDADRVPPFDLTANFDAIVIGSGMYGAYCAARLWGNGGKVLVLEAGPFLISEHYQNLSNVGLGTGGTAFAGPGANPEADTVTDQVWGLPWRSNQIFARQAFCVGGKSLFWGGWAPRLTDGDLDAALPGGRPWPKAAADYLKEYYERIELQLGVREHVVPAPGQRPAAEIRTDLFNDTDRNRLTMQLQPRLQALVGPVEVVLGDGSRVQSRIDEIRPAPIAIQADSPASGLFSFDKFSSLPVLTEAIREDVGRSGNSDQRRRLFLVPNARALTLLTAPSGSGHRVTGIVLWDGRARRTVEVPESCNVVLALSAIESTRLALESFGGIAPLGSLMGRNLMAHVRNNATARIRRRAIGVPQMDILQTSAFHIAGTASNGGHFHLQFYAGFQPGPNAEAVLYRMIPNIESAQALLANQDPDWVSITFRGIGEMFGRTDLAPGDPGASYVDLSQDFDGFGHRRAWVHYVQQPDDLLVFDEMDQAGFAVMRGLVPDDGDIEYWDEHQGRWVAQNPYAPGSPRYGKLKQEGGIRDPLGTTYHDSGTLWMGEDPASSVTDSTGRFHGIRNALCVDQAVFPRVGSANPVPTGLVVARRAAEAIADDGLEVDAVRDGAGASVAFHHRAEPGFTPLFVFDRDPVSREALLPRGWRFVGSGGFARCGLALETQGGIGLLCFEPADFTDFTLRLQWRALTVRNNSGVYVRLPRRHLAEPDRLLKTGYEVQIDNTGERPEGLSFPPPLFNRHHQTGAIYPIHPTDGFPAAEDLPSPNGAPSIQPIPTRPLELWNDLEIMAGGNRIRVVLNGIPTLEGGDYSDARNAYPAGLIALQAHFKGHRVQFRHVRIREGMPQF
ncbi:family 16 glycoside hydrolase [Arenibaculum pallidiluteum]|uniref:family 16 glycoside hydrolase n=1 Tax=Arenibaculum pallidiluteum TaxID=2812559 RepID=UPI001A959753|nr:family 16 glycoside hydrolase [Arenibaculum pallidiluteum]